MKPILKIVQDNADPKAKPKIDQWIDALPKIADKLIAKGGKKALDLVVQRLALFSAKVVESPEIKKDLLEKFKAWYAEAQKAVPDQKKA